MNSEKISELDELYEKNLRLSYENNLEYQKQLEKMRYIWDKLDKYLDLEMERYKVTDTIQNPDDDKKNNILGEW